MVKYKRADHSSMEGEWYEVRVAALLFLRCQRNPNVTQFQLATNAAAGGRKLDDVVLRYKTVDRPDAWRTCFMQLKKKSKKKSEKKSKKKSEKKSEKKSKKKSVATLTDDTLTDNTLTGISKDFSLKSYVESFLHIKQGMSADEREELLNGSLEDCLFVLYTNMPARRELLTRRDRSGSLGELRNLLLGHRDRSRSLGDLDNLLLEGGGGVLGRRDRSRSMGDLDNLLLEGGNNNHNNHNNQQQPVVLGFEKERDAKIFASVKGADGFIEKMKVFHGQPTPDELKTVVKRELLLRGDVTEEYVDALYERYEKRFVRWWDTSDDLLDETSDIYDLALNETRLPPVKDLSSHETARTCFDVRFRAADFPADQSKAMVHVVAPEPCLRSSVTKLLQSVPDLFAFFRTECLEVEIDKILPVWRSNINPRWLVLLASSSEDSHRELGDKICEVLQENREKRIAIVSPRGDNFTSYLKGKLGDDYGEIEYDCRVSQLEIETLDKLREMSVSFQGVTVPAESFFTDHENVPEDIVLDDNLLVSLTSEKTHSVGLTLSKDASYYISRTLLFVGNADEPKGALTVNEEGVRLGGEGCSYCAEGEWAGNAEHVDPASCLERDVDHCFDVPHRRMLVTGEPGMGKTTFASHLARRTKEVRPLFWVVYVNLPGHSRLLEQTSDPVEFLSAVAGVDQSPFHVSLLRRSIESTGNIAVLLDAFDEISPKYESHGLCLIAALLKTKVDRVWVTSRFFVRKALERKMSTHATNLKDLSSENQVDFLARFWRDAIAPQERSDVELNDSIAELLARVSESLAGGERRFTGIPLQTMMLAEVFTNYAADPSGFPLPKELDLIYLLEKFIEKKFTIYVRKLLPEANMNDPIVDDLRTSFNQKHMYASLIYLFPADWLEKLDLKDEIVRKTNEFTSRVLSGGDKTGIVDGVIYERPRFVHRCFAEFFAARFFYEHYKRNRDFLRNYLYRGLSRVVREMWDGLLACRRPLHSAVIRNDIDLVEELIREGCKVNEEDDGGRTPLHLAAGYIGGRTPLHLAAGYILDAERASFYNVTAGLRDRFMMIKGDPIPIGPRRRGIVELLLENGAEVNAVDRVLEWTPLEYAVGAWSWDRAEILLAAGSNPGRLVFPTGHDSETLWSSILKKDHVELRKCIVEQSPFTGDLPKNQYVVERSILNGYVSLVRLLVKNSEDVLTKRLKGRTLLHYAARFGQREILEYLIDILKREVCEIVYADGVNSPDNFGATAMDLAAENGFHDIFRLLSECGGDSKFLEGNYVRLLLTASGIGNFDLVKFVIEGIGDDAQMLRSCLDSADDDGSTSLIVAAVFGHSDILEYLVEKGGDVTLVDNHDCSVLHVTISKLSLTYVKMIIGSLGDDSDAIKQLVNAPFSGGITPIHCITGVNIYSGKARIYDVFEEQARIAEYLIERGANVWSIDKKGKTPLHWAASYFAPLPVAKVLVQSLGNDADAIISYINKTDLNGDTAKDLALQDDEAHSFLSTRKERIEVVNWLDSVLEVTASLKC